jgi:hypothetical protein
MHHHAAPCARPVVLPVHVCVRAARAPLRETIEVRVVLHALGDEGGTPRVATLRRQAAIDVSLRHDGARVAREAQRRRLGQDCGGDGEDSRRVGPASVSHAHKSYAAVRREHGSRGAGPRAGCDKRAGTRRCRVESASRGHAMQSAMQREGRARCEPWRWLHMTAGAQSAGQRPGHVVSACIMRSAPSRVTRYECKHMGDAYLQPHTAHTLSV